MNEWLNGLVVVVMAFGTATAAVLRAERSGCSFRRPSPLQDRLLVLGLVVVGAALGIGIGWVEERVPIPDLPLLVPWQLATLLGVVPAAVFVQAMLETEDPAEDPHGPR